MLTLLSCLNIEMEFILTVLIIIVLLGLLFRLLAPFLLKLFIKRMQKRFGEQPNGNNHSQNRRKQRPEGEITIEKKNSQEKVIDKNFGDYIDFEEEEK